VTSVSPAVIPRFAEDDLPVVLLLIAFAAFACVVPAQADTFYHLRSGLEMWQSRSLLTHEIFAWTEYGKPLPNHWWLGQLLFYGLFAIGGPVLLTISAGALAFAALFLTWKLIHGSHEMRLISLLALGVTLPEWSVRPQVFSLFFCALAIRLVLQNRLVLLPMLLVVWANMHAVVVLGIAVAGAALMDAVIWDRTRLWRTTLVFVASLMAPLVTPLGLQFWPWLFEAVHVSRALDLHEYRSALSPDSSSIGFWILALALLAGLARRGVAAIQADRSTRLLMLMAFALSLPAATSIRNIPFFALAAVPALSRLFPTRDVAGRRKPATVVAWAMVIAAAALAVAAVVLRWSGGGTQLGWRPFTAEARAAIERCPAPIYNGLYEGGQLIWFVPRQKVFVDGRVDVYPLDFLIRARTVDLHGDYRSLFEDYGIRCAVLHPDSPLGAALSRDNRMRLAFRDNQWAVFTD
jgi:hypothetical protein